MTALISAAFAGCSQAYVVSHLSAATCLDGKPHNGSPCLVNDPAREAEAWALMTWVPQAGPGVVMTDGRPVLPGE